MAMASPDKIAEKWAQRMQQSGQAYSEGIDRVTESPMEKAANNSAAYLQGIQDSVASGKWQAGLRRRDLSYWKNAAKSVGAQRIGSGAVAAKPKMQQFLSQFLPALEANISRVKSMPNTTFEERLARMNEMARLNHNFKRS